jgi:hypothetical protein
MDKPRIFLGSSGKQEKLLQALTRGLGEVAHVEPWRTSFTPGTTTLERLLDLTHEVDFAAFVFAQDDWTTNSPPASSLQGSGQASPQGVIWNWWRQAMMGGIRAHYDGIVAFSQTDFKGFPHGMPTTNADQINADLLEFIKS